MFRRNDIDYAQKSRQSDLSYYLTNQLNYAVSCNSEIIYRNVYQSMCNYLTAFDVVGLNDLAHICDRYIESLKILAKKDGIKL